LLRFGVKGWRALRSSDVKLLRLCQPRMQGYEGMYVYVGTKICYVVLRDLLLRKRLEKACIKCNHFCTLETMICVDGFCH